MTPERFERLEKKVDLIVRILETLLSRLPEEEDQVEGVTPEDLRTLDGEQGGADRDQTLPL